MHRHIHTLTHTLRQHTQQHKKIYILYIILCIVCFTIGMCIAKATASPVVEKEPTAYELIEEIHRQRGE